MGVKSEHSIVDETLKHPLTIRYKWKRAKNEDIVMSKFYNPDNVHGAYK